MRRNGFKVLIASIFLISLFVGVAYSQEEEEHNFDQAYAKYTLSIEEYRKAHDDHKLARSQYIKFQTLTSKTNAQNATLPMLEARDEVVLNYLKSLRKKIEETNGIQDGTKEGLYFRLDEEINWFKDHKERLSSAGSLEDLVEDSDEAEKQFKSEEALFHEVLSETASGKVSNFRNRLNDIFGRVSELVNEIREEEREEYQFSTRKIQIIDRWMFETDSRISRSMEKQVEAEDEIEKITGKRKSNNATYNSILKSLEESHLYLKEASAFVKEIIREVKTAEE